MRAVVLQALRAPASRRAIELPNRSEVWIGGYVGAKSPDRLDALMWALSDLVLEPQHAFSIQPLRR